MMGSTELRAKLEWIANAKRGDDLPDWLGGADNAWGPPMSEIAKAALDFVPDDRGVITIAGIQYDMDLFHAMGIGPLDERPTRVIKRADGVLTLECVPTWRLVAEIATVIRPWTRDLPSYYRHRCMIQMVKRANEEPWIQEGWAYWFKSRHSNSEPVVRWACSNGLCTPQYFQAFPEPRTD